MWMSTLLISLHALSVGVAGAPVPVILDTDLGDDIDDTWALGMLLGCPEVDLKLVVTAADNTIIKTRLVAKILEAMGRTDIPLGRGVCQNDHGIHQEAWLGDYHLDTYPGTLHGDGVQVMIDLIKASPVPVTLLVIGPQTNIQEALRRDPSIADNARIVSMAGSVHIGYDGKEGRQPEWNVKKDVAAAKAVFAAPWEIIMAPLDSCGMLRLDGDRYKAVAESGNPLAKAVIANYEAWANRKHHPAGSSSILFDTVAAYLAFDDAFCRMETVILTIDDAGNTIPAKEGRPVRCALSWNDEDAFKDLLVASLTTKRP